jgi:hypothetical protein
MSRRPGWERALADYIEAARYRPFQWGRHDCLLFAAGAVCALTGDDLAGWLPPYDNIHRARSLLREYGDGALAAAVSKYLGPPLAGPLFARRGDVALVKPAVAGADRAPVIMQESLGVVVGAHVAMPGINAMAFLPVSQALLAWRV